MIPGIGSTTTTPTDPMDPKAVATKVQAMFMEVMIKAMEDSVGGEDGMYGDNSTSEIYRGMFREQLGKTMGESIGGSLQAELEKKGLVFNTADTQSFRDMLDKAGFYREWREKLGGEVWTLLEKQVGKLG